MYTAHLRLSATGVPEHLEAQDTRRDSIHGANGSGELSAGSSSLMYIYQIKLGNMALEYKPVMIGTAGRNFEIRRAVFPLVDSTKIALAFCSDAAATAAIATVSTVSVGRMVEFLSSSYKGG